MTFAFIFCLADLLALAAGDPQTPWNPQPPGRFREIWSVDESIETEIQGEVDSAYTTLHTGHFAITHASRIEIARYRGDILESVYAAFVLYFDSHGFDLEIPPSLLQTIFFRTREELVLHLGIPDLPENVSGLYRGAISRGYFFDTLGRNEIRETNKQIEARTRALKKMLRRVQRADKQQRFGWKIKGRPERQVSKSEARRLINAELRIRSNNAGRYRAQLGQSSLETMCHEAAHQLSHRMAVLDFERPTPLWLTEGLATFFEPSRNGYLLETGSIHWQRLNELNRSHTKGQRIPIAELLTKDELFHDWAGATLAYHEAWSLFHYLATMRADELMKYLRALRSAGSKDSPERRVELFEASFGSNLTEIEERWQAHVSGLKNVPSR